MLTLKDAARALAAYEQAAGLEPEDAWTWIEITRLARQVGNLTKAAAAAARARAAAAKSADARGAPALH